MKLLYFTRRYTNHDARWLRVLATPGVELAFLSLECVKEEQFISNHPKVVLLASPAIASNASTAALHLAEPAVRAEWLRWSPDVVMAGPLTDAGYLATRIDATKTLLVSWAFDVLEEPRFSADARHRLQRTLASAHGLLADCEAISVQCEKIAGFSPAVRCVMPWGLGPEDRPLAASPRQRNESDDSAFVLLNTRGFEPVQQPLLLLESFRQARIQQPNLKLWLAGQGTLRALAEAFVFEHKLGAAVSFLGYLNHEELSARFHQADAYVACARSDGSSLSLLQAMDAGLPCIVADLASNREWIDARGGWLAPVEDVPAFTAALLACANSTAAQREQAAAWNRQQVADRADLSANLPRLWTALRQLAQSAPDLVAAA